MDQNVKHDLNPEEPKFVLRKDLVRPFGGKDLYRIQALRDFADVKAGDLGGFLEFEHLLSQQGTCWVYSPNCLVLGEQTCITDHAVVYNGVHRNIQTPLTIIDSFIGEYSRVAGSVIFRSNIRDHTKVNDCTLRNCKFRGNSDLFKADLYADVGTDRRLNRISR